MSREFATPKAPAAIGERDLLTVDRARDGKHRGLRTGADLLDVARDRRFEIWRCIVLENTDMLRVAVRASEREAAVGAADVGEKDASHSTAPNTIAASRARAPQGKTGPDSSRSAPPDTGWFRGICARYQTPRRNQTRRASGRTYRRPRATHRRQGAWPDWPRRRTLVRRHKAPLPRAPSTQPRAFARTRAQSETARPGFSQWGGRRHYAPWHRRSPWR